MATRPHPEAWRELRDLDDDVWEGQLTDADLRTHHRDVGDRYRDSDGHAALAYGRDMDRMREAAR